MLVYADYRTVYDLTEDEIAELRATMFWSEDVLGEQMREEYEFECNIPRSVVEDYYEDTYFVEEDFFCNIMAG